MNQNKLKAAAILILFLIPLCWGAEMQGNERDQRPPFSEMLRRTFLNSADNSKIMFNRAQSYFFSPNLEFRGSSIPREERMMDGGGAPEDNLKDAVAESVGKTKATVEGSAKSAAELATKTIKETKEKVKRTLSPPPHSEL